MYDYQSFQKEIFDLDKEEIEKHNQRHPSGTKYHLHLKMSPCPFEGNLYKAKIILLLANPHYLEGASEPEDHIPIPGWGIWGLNEKAPLAIKDWWRPRLRHFINKKQDNEEWKQLSFKIASFQAVPWASMNFHKATNIPSKEKLRKLIQDVAQKDKKKIFVAMRQRAYWSEVLKDAKERLIMTKNYRCSHLSPGNLAKKDWDKIKNILSND